MRGYNQTEILANSLAKRLYLRSENRILRRSRRVKSQRRLSRRLRLQNQKDSFCIWPAKVEYLKGKKILLVDDIITTGATAFEAAKILKAAGVESVTLCALAKTA